MGSEQHPEGDQGPDQGAEQGASPRSGKPPPASGKWKKGQSGNPKGRPKGKGLTDAVRRVAATEHNGKAMVDILAEVAFKHALAGKFPHFKEIWDRLEGKPGDTVTAKIQATHRHFVVPPPRMLSETDEEYDARMQRDGHKPSGPRYLGPEKPE